MKIGEKIMKACGKEVYDGMRNVFFGVSKLDKLGVGATWINTKTGKHYRYDGINWIDTDALSNPSDKIICLNGDLDNLLTWDEYCEVINKQKEEGKMETAVQEVKFKETGVMQSGDGKFSGPVGTATEEFAEIFHYGDFTVARMRKEIDGKKWQGIGISRQSKEDQRNEKLGDSIALGRARKAISTKLKGEIIRHPYMA